MSKVVVVGAGFAGLATAVSLADAGFDVTVVEARSRVGGRVWSETFGPHGVVIERGAEFVLHGYETMSEHLARFGLSLVDTGMSYYVRDPRGAGDVTVDDVAAAGAAVSRLATSGRTAQEVLGSLDLRAEVVEALRARIEISSAWPAHRLAAEVVTHVGSTTAHRSFRVGGGNQSLARAMADHLGDRVICDQPVRIIRHRETDVEIVTADTAYLADAVVVTVPLPLLPTLAFEPSMPEALVSAWGAAVMGHAAKIHVPLRGTPPTTAVMSVPERYWTWTATDASGSVAPMLHGFAGTPGALDVLAVEQGPGVWAASVARLRPDLDLDVDAAQVTTWSDDPWSRGAYSADDVSLSAADVALLSVAVGRVFFAGEHTAGEWAGLMEGALRSGVRAAADVLTQSRAGFPAV